MKKFASGLRSILLVVAMIAGLVICVLHAKVETTSDSFLTLVFLASGALYLFVSIISLIVRFISRANMNERDQMMDSFNGVLVYLRNGNILHFFRRLSFWGTIMLIVNVVAFNLTSNMVIGGPYSPDIFLSGYHGFLLWSLIALIVSFVLSLIFWVVFMPHYGEGAYNIFQYTGKIIVSDIIEPFRIIKSFFSGDGKKNVVGLIAMVSFIVVNVVAVLKNL